MGSAILAIVKQFWRELAIVGLFLFIWGANEFYVEKIKLERDLAVSKKEQIEKVLNDQSQKILDAAEETKQIVQTEFSELDSRLDALSDEQKQQLEDLIDLEIPEGCGEELNEFLINVAEQELRWKLNEDNDNE